MCGVMAYRQLLLVRLVAGLYALVGALLVFYASVDVDHTLDHIFTSDELRASELNGRHSSYSPSIGALLGVHDLLR